MHVQLQEHQVVVTLSMREPLQKLHLSICWPGTGGYAGTGLKMSCVLVEIITKGTAEDTGASAEVGYGNGILNMIPMRQLQSMVSAQGDSQHDGTLRRRIN